MSDKTLIIEDKEYESLTKASYTDYFEARDSSKKGFFFSLLKRNRNKQKESSKGN